MCKDILTLAGPEVEAKLKSGEKKIKHFKAMRTLHFTLTHFVSAVLSVAKVKTGEVVVTTSGSFPCKVIFHVCGEQDAGVIEQLVCDIIRRCEALGLKSVAIPAICAGKYMQI